MVTPQTSDISQKPDSRFLSSENELVICSIYEDQRPLKGAAGLLDWRLRGFLSRFAKQGRITGQAGEIVYIPLHHQQNLRHLLLVGLGSSKKQEGENADLLKKIAQTSKKMRFEKIVISRSSFELWDENKLRKAFTDARLEFME